MEARTRSSTLHLRTSAPPHLRHRHPLPPSLPALPRRDPPPPLSRPPRALSNDRRHAPSRPVSRIPHSPHLSPPPLFSQLPLHGDRFSSPGSAGAVSLVAGGHLDLSRFGARCL